MSKIVKSVCICGKEYCIELNSNHTRRTDRKRIYHVEETRKNVCSFRCRDCLRCVHESVPGAEFGELKP